MQAQAGMEEERWTDGTEEIEGRTQAEDPFSVFCLFGSTSSYTGHRDEKKEFPSNSHHTKAHHFSTTSLLLLFPPHGNLCFACPKPTPLYSVLERLTSALSMAAAKSQTAPLEGTPALPLSGGAGGPGSHHITSHRSGDPPFRVHLLA